MITALPVLEDEAGGRRYRLLRELGSGGFGAVYLAAVTSPAGLEQLVAVKLLHGRADARAQPVERLQDEARLLASLRHPVILAAHDLVRFGERIALVTEFVEGEDLAACLAHPTDPLPRGPLIEVVGQVAGALAAAWRQLGTVHRDIKPANIRVGRHGNVKLLDFGVARSTAGERAAATATDAVVGSFGYLGPERFEPGPPHSASDVFALGCVWYEGWVGRRLFAGLDAPRIYGLLVSPRFEPFVQEALAAADLTPEVHEILAQCLARDPARRPSAEALAALCDQLRDPAHSSLRRWAAEHPWVELDVSPAERSPSTLFTRVVPAAEAPAPAPPSVGSPAPRPVPSRRWWWGGAALAATGVVAAVACSGVGVGLAASLAQAPWRSAIEPIPGQAPVVEAPSAAARAEPPAPDPVEPAAPPVQPDPAESAPESFVLERRPAEPVVLGLRPAEPSRSTGSDPAESRTVSVVGDPGVFFLDGAAMGETNRSYSIVAGSHRCGIGVDKTAALATADCAVSGALLVLPELPPQVTADRIVELRGGTGTHRLPARVPAGRYAVWADFGSGLQDAGQIEVSGHGSVAVRCNAVRGTCGT